MSSAQEVRAPWLGDLSPGDLSLRAPVFNDVVQINYFKENPNYCRLSLDIDTEAIRICREDGKKLQLEVAPALFGDASSVLREPVEEIVLQNAHTGDWLIGPDTVVVEYMTGFEIFTSLIAQHALTKQVAA